MEETRCFTQNETIENNHMSDVQFLYGKIEALQSKLAIEESKNRQLEEEIKNYKKHDEKNRLYIRCSIGVITKFKAYMTEERTMTTNKKLLKANADLEQWWFNVLSTNNNFKSIYDAYR